MIYHTPDEHTWLTGLMIYHTPDEHTWLEPMIYHTPDEHTNHYTTDGSSTMIRGCLK
jgi:hypothetical protein